VEYSDFKPLLGLLFFGAVFAFGIWQLIDLKRDAKPKARDADPSDRSDADAGS
jgi:hypothetical protein